MCCCAPFVGHIPPMSLQNPKFPSKLNRTEMADEAELFCTSASKTVVFARLLVSVNDLHRGLSSSVFRVEQITQNQVPQGVPVRVRPPAPRRQSKVCSAQNPAAQNGLPDFFACVPLLLLYSEHSKRNGSDKRTKDKHQKGNARRQRNQGGEKKKQKSGWKSRR